MTFQTHQAKSAKLASEFAFFSDTPNEPRRGLVSRRLEGRRCVSRHDETPARFKRRALSARFRQERTSGQLQADRYQDMRFGTRHREGFAGVRSGVQGVAASYDVAHRTGVNHLVADRPQFVSHASFRRRGFALFQVPDGPQVVEMLHGSIPLRSRGKATAFDFDETAVFPFGKLAENGRVQRRVRRLASGTRPIAGVRHRGNHFLGVQRFLGFAQDFQRRLDTRELLFAGRCRHTRRVGPVRLLCDSFAGSRFAGRTGRRRRSCFTKQPLSRFDSDLFVGRKIRGVPAAGRVGRVDSYDDLLVGHVGVVLAAYFYVCLLHRSFSERERFVVGCHLQATGTTRRYAKPPCWRFGFGLQDRPQNALVELFQQLAKDVVLFEQRAGRSAMVEVGNLKGVYQGPKVFGDAVVALANLLGGMCVHVSEERCKGFGAGLLGFVHGHGLFSGGKGGYVLPLGVKTHEPWFSKHIKRISASSGNVFKRLSRTRITPERVANSGSKVFPEMFLQFAELFAKMLQGTDVLPIQRCGFATWCRQVFDRFVQVFEQREGLNVRGGVGVFEFGVGHGCVSRFEKGKEAGFERSPRWKGPADKGPRLAIAAGFPGSLAAVANLPAFDDVDDRVFRDVLVVEVLAGVFLAGFVHLRAAGDAGDSVFKGPILLRHQTHFGVRPVLFAVLVQQFDQGVNRHRWVSVFGKENSSCVDTHEPWFSRHSKRIRPAICSLFACFSISPTCPIKATCRRPRNTRPLRVTYANDATRAPENANVLKETNAQKKSRGVGRGVEGKKLVGRLDRLVVLASHLQKLLLDRFPVAGLFAGRKLAVSFRAKGSFTPADGPAKAVVQAVEFRFAFARAVAIPAAFGARSFGVVPTATASRGQSQLGQAQYHLDVAEQFGFVQRAGEGSNLDPVSAASKVRQVQKVVAVRFAVSLCSVLVAVAFDLLRPSISLASFRSRGSVDGSLVVSDQAYQPSQGGRVAVPSDRDVKAAAFVNPSPACFDRVDRSLYVLKSVVAAKDRRYELGVLASDRRADAAIAFCFPAFGQPSYRQAVVVSADRRGVVSGQVSFDFDTEGDVVGVHGWVSERWLGSCVSRGVLLAACDT